MNARIIRGLAAIGIASSVALAFCDLASAALPTPPATQTAASIAFDSTSPNPAIFSSNGNSVEVYYKFAINDANGKAYVNGPDVPLIVRAYYLNVSEDKVQRGSLSCPSTGSVTGQAKNGAIMRLEYVVTGYTNVYSSLEPNAINNADVNFTLKLPGSGGQVICTGMFNYFRSTYPDQVVRPMFRLEVSDPKRAGFQAETKINIAFVAPLVAAPRIVYSAANSYPLNTSRFTSAIQTPGTSFSYRLVYINGYSLPAPGTKITCTIGGAPSFTLVTDSYGQIALTGSITMAMQPRTTTPPIPPAVWDVTTSLTGSNKAFTLTKGKPIGKVSCASPDETPATYSQDLGTW